MVDFVARLDLPLFIPKEEILGKYVFDYDIVCIGLVKDWTYMSDGEVKMIVRRKTKKDGSSTVLIPFNQIDRVGQFILLKTRRAIFEEKPKEPPPSPIEKAPKPQQQQKNNELKSFDRIDPSKLDHVIGKKSKTL